MNEDEIKKLNVNDFRKGAEKRAEKIQEERQKTFVGGGVAFNIDEGTPCANRFWERIEFLGSKNISKEMSESTLQIVHNELEELSKDDDEYTKWKEWASRVLRKWEKYKGKDVNNVVSALIEEHRELWNESFEFLRPASTSKKFKEYEGRESITRQYPDFGSPNANEFWGYIGFLHTTTIPSKVWDMMRKMIHAQLKELSEKEENCVGWREWGRDYLLIWETYTHTNINDLIEEILEEGKKTLEELRQGKFPPLTKVSPFDKEGEGETRLHIPLKYRKIKCGRSDCRPCSSENND